MVPRYEARVLASESASWTTGPPCIVFIEGFDQVEEVKYFNPVFKGLGTLIWQSLIGSLGM